MITEDMFEVLADLYDHGKTYGSDIARSLGFEQWRVTSRILPALEEFGYVQRAGTGHGLRKSSKPAQFWQITTEGRLAAEAFVH